MKLTKVKLRQVIMEELQKAAANPFGTGMEQLGTGDPKEIVGHTWLTHARRKGSAIDEVGKVMWHSLEENGHIAVYDIKWSDGTVETGIPAGLLETVSEGSHDEDDQHGVQEQSMPLHMRKYKD